MRQLEKGEQARADSFPVWLTGREGDLSIFRFPDQTELKVLPTVPNQGQKGATESLRDHEELGDGVSEARTPWALSWSSGRQSRHVETEGGTMCGDTCALLWQASGVPAAFTLTPSRRCRELGIPTQKETNDSVPRFEPGLWGILYPPTQEARSGEF